MILSKSNDFYELRIERYVIKILYMNFLYIENRLLTPMKSQLYKFAYENARKFFLFEVFYLKDLRGVIVKENARLISIAAGVKKKSNVIQNVMIVHLV